MSTHKLMSPTSTYAALPTVGGLNKGLQQTQDQIQLRKKLLQLTEITTRHNGQKLLQIKSLQGEKSGTAQSSSKPITGRSIHTISVTRKPTNINMQNGNKTQVVNNNPRVPDRGPAGGRRNGPSGMPLSDIPGTSTQSGASSDKRGGGNSKTRPKNDELHKNYVEDSDVDSDSSSQFDISEIRLKRSIESLRLPYTAKEDVAIMKYVLLAGNIDRTGSLSLWRELETQMGEPKRTYQSLKNRFLRNIKPHLLTKYRRFLTPETLARVKKKFPDLKGVKPYHVVIEERITRRQAPAGNSAERPVASDNRPRGENPLLQNKSPPPTARESTTASMEKRVAVDNEIIPSSQQNRKLTSSPIRVTAVEELERRETVAVSGDGSAGSATSAAVELFVPGKSQNLPIQSFQCTKIIKTLQDKTNLNLNIVLLNDQSSLLSKLTGPVKVDIVVSVSSVQESRIATEKTDAFRLEEVPKAPKTAVKKRKKRRIKPRPKKNVKTKKKYFLRLKKCNYQKLLNLTPEYKQSLAGLLRRIECNVSERDEAAAKEGRNRMVLRSRTREESLVSNEGRMILRSRRREPASNELSDSEDDDDDDYDYDGMTQSGQTRDREDNDMIGSSQTREESPSDNEAYEDAMTDESPTGEASPDELSNSDDEIFRNSQTRKASPAVEPSKEVCGDRMILRSRIQEPDDNENRMRLRSRTPIVDGSSQTSTQETNCSAEDDSDYSQMYREVTKRYQVVTVAGDDGSEGWEQRKRPKMEEKQTKGNILLKNMVGMLSPSSRVFSNQQYPSKSLSKKI